MEPPLITRTLLPVSAHCAPDAEVCKEGKELSIRKAEQSFLENKSEKTLLSYLCLLLYACEFEQLKKAIDNHPEFSDFTTLFRAYYCLKFGKLYDCATFVNKYMRIFIHSAEAMYLAASLQSLVKDPIAFDVNFGVIALTHYFRNDYKAARLAYEKMIPGHNNEWIKILIDTAEGGCTPEIVEAMNQFNLPRCALISLLNTGFKSDELERIVEAKLKIYPYDYSLRDALMSYYALHGCHGRALFHYDLFEKGDPPEDTFHFKAAFNLKIGRIDTAKEILDRHRPQTILSYEKIVKLYKQIPNSSKNIKKAVIDGLKKFPKSTFLLMERAYIILEEEGVSEAYKETIDQILKILPHHYEALLRKASSLDSFKAAKKYLTILENVYPDCEQTLKIGSVIRFEFGEEINRALSDVERLRKMRPDFEFEKMYVDILIYLERYDDVIKEAGIVKDELKHLYKFRVIICLLRSNHLEMASHLLTQYEEVTELTTHELCIKGELLAAQGKFAEAYDCFQGIRFDNVFISFRSIRAYFLCLKKLNKVDEARKAYDKVPEHVRGLYGECTEWLRSMPKSNPGRQGKPPRATTVAVGAFVEQKKNRPEADELVKPSKNSISLIKGKFSAAVTEGIDPLYRKGPKAQAQEVALKCLIEPYPQQVLSDLDEAIKNLYEIRACFNQTMPSIEQIKYHMIQFLSVLHRDPYAIPIISSRVINFECLRHSFSLISKYPFLCSPKQVRRFAQECIPLAKALSDSKTKFANISDFNESPVESPKKFDEYPRSKKIEFLLKYIREQLVFIKDCQYECVDLIDEKQSKVVVLALWQIRSAIRLVFNLDVDMANKLRSLFPEFQASFSTTCYEQQELDGVNFEMAAYVYLSASSRLDAIDRISCN